MSGTTRDGHGARSTHIVYRIGTDFSWQETPCFCSADHDHPVTETRVASPVVPAPADPNLRSETAFENIAWQEREADGWPRFGCPDHQKVDPRCPTCQRMHSAPVDPSQPGSGQ